MVEMIFEKKTKGRMIREELQALRISPEYIEEDLQRGTVKVVFKKELSADNRQLVINIIKNHGLDLIEQK